MSNPVYSDRLTVAPPATDVTALGLLRGRICVAATRANDSLLIAHVERGRLPAGAPYRFLTEDGLLKSLAAAA